MKKVSDYMQHDPITARSNQELSHAVKRLRENNIGGMPVTENNEVVGMLSETDILDLIDEEQENNNIWLPSPFEAIELPLRAFPWREWMEKHGLLRETLTDIGEIPVSKVMTKKVITASPDESLESAAGKMNTHDINRLPVIKNGKLVGLITRGDVLRGIADKQSDT